MKPVVGDLPPTWYDRPSGIVDRLVCVNPSKLGGNGSGVLPGPYCPAGFRFAEHYVEGTEPKSNDADFYQACGIRLIAPFSDWQPYYNAWASGAVSGTYSYGRFNWSICGFAPKPSPSPSPSGGYPFATPPPRVTIPPFPTPRPQQQP
jgi:hypothetical protein